MKTQEAYQWLFFQVLFACIGSQFLPLALSAVVLIFVLLDIARGWSREMRKGR
jgi:hypothetical protein